MSKIVWDKLDERFFDQGVSRGVMYDGVAGAYVDGVPWNGLVNVTQSPSGAEPNKQYADNIVYVNLLSAEEFSATIEAFMAPKKFDKYNGVASTANGLRVSGQNRGVFGFCWRTERGTAENPTAGFVINIAYGCQASPSEKSNATKSDTPELTSYSWSLSTTPVAVEGFEPTAFVSVDSTDPNINPANLTALLDILYGTVNTDPRLPLPDEIDEILGNGVTAVTPIEPAFDEATDTLTVPVSADVDYVNINTGDVLPDGPVVLTEDTIVEARPTAGRTFTGVYVDRWLYQVA